MCLIISGDYNILNYLGRMPNCDKGNHCILRSERNKFSSFRTSFWWGLLIVLEKPRKALTYGSKSRKYWSVLRLVCYLVSRPNHSVEESFSLKLSSLAHIFLLTSCWENMWLWKRVASHILVENQIWSQRVLDSSLPSFCGHFVWQSSSRWFFSDAQRLVLSLSFCLSLSSLCQSGQGESARGEAGEVEAALRALSSATTPWKRIFGGSTFLGFSPSVNRTLCTNANLLFVSPWPLLAFP